MPAGLMVKVKNGKGLGSLFHPTLPFSYTIGRVDVPGVTFGPGVHTFTFTFDAPFPLNKPYFTLSAMVYNVGDYTFEKVANTEKTYRCTGARHIINIDPRNGRIDYQKPDLALLDDISIVIGDIRG